MDNKLQYILSKSHISKSNGDKIGLPAYYLYLHKDEKKVNERDITKTQRITSCKARKTTMHVILTLYKPVL
jgi:hypothetical protein